MIARLTGIVIDSDTTSLTIDVGGVGYRVFATTATIAAAKSLPSTSPASLHTHLAVRENAMDLYGFFEAVELTFFELLLTVSGIGPKSALSILNIADIGTLRDAILRNDSSYLTKVSGIGAKSAQKIVLELQGKLDGLSIAGGASAEEDMDVLEALTALGYSQGEVRKVLKDLPSDVEGANARIKEALKLLGK